MSRSLNKVQLIGNLGSDPEVRTTQGGTKLAKVSIATSREWTARNGHHQERTEWHRLTFWDKLAGVVEEYLHKGDRIYIEGRLEYSQTEDEEGHTRYWTDIRVRDLVMLGSPNGKGASSGGGASRSTSQSSPPVSEDPDFGDPDPHGDLPF